MADLVIDQRLFGADLRMLACRAFPDPTQPGCLKVRVRWSGGAGLLCQRRVEAFLAEATSLAGLTCISLVPDPPVEDADLP